MARPSKIEVAAINIRLGPHVRDYIALLKAITGLRRGVQVFGENFVAINYFDPEDGVGIISKYSEMDINGEWFNIEDFDAASPEQLVEISVPDNLKPNLSQYYFQLDASLHILTFETYSNSRALSAKSVEKYFKKVLSFEEINKYFGRVEADIVKSYDEVERILSSPYLKELKFIIRRPNPDDVADDLAAVIEERLREQHADEYEEILRAKGQHLLEPSERTKKLGFVAAENGQVRARVLVNGVMTTQDTTDTPLIEVETYTADESEINVFRRLSASIFKRISSRRAP